LSLPSLSASVVDSLRLEQSASDLDFSPTIPFPTINIITHRPTSVLHHGTACTKGTRSVTGLSFLAWTGPKGFEFHRPLLTPTLCLPRFLLPPPCYSRRFLRKRWKKQWKKHREKLRELKPPIFSASTVVALLNIGWWVALRLILLSGDVHENPGPSQKTLEEKGASLLDDSSSPPSLSPSSSSSLLPQQHQQQQSSSLSENAAADVQHHVVEPSPDQQVNEHESSALSKALSSIQSFVKSFSTLFGQKARTYRSLPQAAWESLSMIALDFTSPMDLLDSTQMKALPKDEQVRCKRAIVAVCVCNIQAITRLIMGYQPKKQNKEDNEKAADEIVKELMKNSMQSKTLIEELATVLKLDISNFEQYLQQLCDQNGRFFDVDWQSG
jgi:hypothetical protein